MTTTESIKGITDRKQLHVLALNAIGNGNRLEPMDDETLIALATNDNLMAKTREIIRSYSSQEVRRCIIRNPLTTDAIIKSLLTFRHGKTTTGYTKELLENKNLSVERWQYILVALWQLTDEEWRAVILHPTIPISLLLKTLQSDDETFKSLIESQLRSRIVALLVLTDAGVTEGLTETLEVLPLSWLVKMYETE